MSYNLNILGDDGSGVDVIGSSGTPTILAVADTYVSQAGLTDVLNYRQATWYAVIAAIGTATKITLKIEWSEDATSLAQQGFEAIAADVATVSSGIWEYTAVAGALEPIPLPVIAPNAKVSIKADIGTTTTCYVRVARQA